MRDGTWELVEVKLESVLDFIGNLVSGLAAAGLVEGFRCSLFFKDFVNFFNDWGLPHDYTLSSSCGVQILGGLKKWRPV